MHGRWCMRQQRYVLDVLAELERPVTVRERRDAWREMGEAGSSEK